MGIFLTTCFDALLFGGLKEKNSSCSYLRKMYELGLLDLGPRAVTTWYHSTCPNYLWLV